MITGDEFRERVNDARALVGIGPLPKDNPNDSIIRFSTNPSTVYGELARPSND